LSILVNTPLPPAPPSERESKPEPVKTQWSVEAPEFVPQATSRRYENDDTNQTRHRRNKEEDSTTTSTPTITLVEEQVGYITNDGDDEEEFWETNREDRSVVFRGLSPFTTLADIVRVVRGGPVLNMFVRAKDRIAHVAFVDTFAAEKFLIQSKRSDIYVKGKRVSTLVFMIT